MTSLSEDMQTKINEIHQRMTREPDVASYSTMNLEKLERFRIHTGIEIRALDYHASSSRDIDAYDWTDCPENHPSQLKRIIEYLNKHLQPNLPHGIIILDVIDKRDFLNIYNNPVIPFDTRGGTDVALVDESYVKASISRAGIRGVVELKKMVQESHVPQIVMEMVGATSLVNEDSKVFGLLTDLGDVWNFYWIGEEKEIMTVNISHRKAALNFISRLTLVTDRQSDRGFQIPGLSTR